MVALHSGAETSSEPFLEDVGSQPVMAVGVPDHRQAGLAAALEGVQILRGYTSRGVSLITRSTATK